MELNTVIMGEGGCGTNGKKNPNAVLVEKLE
jgi:hypothetical protein